MIICEIEECTGCYACLNICTHNAISMQKGTNGHLYPVIDEEMCVKCNQCGKVCPNNTLPDFHAPIATYIATAQNPQESKTSTSAGIASVFSRYIVENGGVVYGSCGENCQKIQHIRITKSEEIEELKGSKYVQSSIGETFCQLREDLKKGFPVLFIGTPCQVAGLNQFLKKGYENLYTIDLICHGVPSQQILNDALKSYLPDTILDEVNLKFRKKEKGKSLYGLFVEDKQGKSLYRSVYPDNEYITGFLCGLFYRESCYQCHYARPERVSDITVGDYWDSEKKIHIDNANGGLSMLIVNTPAGQHLLELCEAKINVLPSNYSDFIKRNGQLDHPLRRFHLYGNFIKDYEEHGFLWASQKNLKEEKQNVRKALLKMRIKDCILSMPLGNKVVGILRNIKQKRIVTPFLL